ncbi:TPA: hypothetical protein ACH3X1_011535 [Trebouxia sp. C0004]
MMTKNEAHGVRATSCSKVRLARRSLPNRAQKKNVGLCVCKKAECFVGWSDQKESDLQARLPEDPQLPELDAVESKDAEAPEADPFGLNALVPEKKRFSHPVADLSPSALLIYGGQGIIEARNNTGPNGDLCGGLSIRAKVPFSPLVTLQTTVGVTVQGAEETDVYGVPFIVSGSGQRFSLYCVG